MYYEINVAKDGRHYFATAERSCTSIEHAARVYEDLCLKFPECSITVTRQTLVGRTVTDEIEEYLNRGRE